jgi:ATPase subunit of ABC transporter with duplicated ATPase domains
MMIAETPPQAPLADPLDAMKDKVQSLLKEYAPRELLDDEEACEYLTSLLASSTEEQSHESLVEVIQGFFGDDHQEEASKLVEKVSKLSLTEARREVTVRKTVPTRLGPEHQNDHEHQLSSSPTSSDDSSTRKMSEKTLERRRKREARKGGRRKRLEGSKSPPRNKLQEDEKFVDDDVSAWADCKAEGKTWGGRGYGGRGVRSEVNTASNIHLANVTLSFAGNELLQNSTIQINGGHRYGLIGRNGAGKSTLLRRLATKSIPGMPQDLRILLVEQAAEGTKETALESLVNSDEYRRELLREQAILEGQIDQGTDNVELEEIVERLGEVATELDTIDADRIEERAREILRSLQFTNDMIDSPSENLSGGWRMRLALARSLIVTCDLLLLDEPTNFLDLASMDWLADYLVSSNQTLIVVSHDRSFLDICTDIISMDHKKLVYHVGSFSDYELQQEEKAAYQAQKLDATERQRAKAVSFIQKQEASANKKRSDPNKQRQAKMIKEKKLERIGNNRYDGKRYKTHSLKKLSEEYIRLGEKVEIEADEPVLRLSFPEPTWPTGITPGSPLVKMEDLSFGYTKDQPFLLNHMTLQVDRGSKISIVGRNGSGKSTILKLVTGEIIPDASNEYKGSVWRNPNLRIGHVTQHSVETIEEYAHMTVVEYADKYFRSGKACSSIIQNAGGNIRQFLGGFGLGGKHALRHIGSLSGGERMRLRLAQVLSEQPHLLVLDEPSNFLDMETLDALSAALNVYQGSVLIVSHNQAFLSGFCKDLWVVESGRVDVRHSDTDTFDEMFSKYRTEAMVGASFRSSKRKEKANMAKLAKNQRSGVKQSAGFI